ncbi:NUDIX hydrolase [Heyndrickxia camelliae]|uniref:DNA mismatch repair protein MutT n=1 Tax=Heyndrickxia camelliae TaxID=1707093 RepID=A0A2N3LQ78_9BACI|nr:NUDIX hydrolase [Heyndrickxia camelliae]PKR86719.1 DNA mismatch repair protein MutT [Heyndrickxia camelliae]
MGYIEDLRAIVGHRPLIFVGAVVIILDEQKRILLQQRTFPNGVWGLPGGLMELAESVEETASREVFEETGLKVHDLNLINVYSGANHFAVAQNGDEFYVVTVAYFTNKVEGDITVDKTESIQLQYFVPDQFPAQMVGSHREILKEFIEKHYKNI